jgi:hypothetical protein
MAPWPSPSMAKNQASCIAATRFDQVTSGFYTNMGPARFQLRHAANSLTHLVILKLKFEISDCDTSLSFFYLVSNFLSAGRLAHSTSQSGDTMDHRISSSTLRSISAQWIADQRCVYPYDTRLTPPHRVSTSKLARPSLRL